MVLQSLGRLSIAALCAIAIIFIAASHIGAYMYGRKSVIVENLDKELDRLNRYAKAEKKLSESFQPVKKAISETPPSFGCTDVVHNLVDKLPIGTDTDPN
jgi:hypothetical protein